MLRFVTGAARTGKTTWIHGRMTEISAAGGRAVLIVPEQSSFSNERALYRRLDGHTGKIDVVSFTRLSELILRELGGITRELMDPAAASLMMSLALEEVKDELSVYRRNAFGHGFLARLADAAAEARNAGVTPEALAAFSMAQPDGPLREKTFELSLILDAYRAVVGRSFTDPADLVDIAAKRLPGSGYFAGAAVFVDGFYSFTAPEYHLLEQVMAGAEELCVSLCCDRILSKEPAFQPAVKAAERLMRIAARNGIPAETAVRFPDQDRHGSPSALAFEAAARGEGAPGPGAEKQLGIRAYLAPNPQEEIRMVAASIAALVRDEGFRYRDIAVIGRDLTRYRTLLPAVFAEWGIPAFLDERGRARQSALLSGVVCAVELACGVGRREMQELLKSPVFGIDPKTAGECENYCTVWSVRKKDWFLPFRNHPDGMVEQMSDAARERLERIEACRRTVAEPMVRLRTAARQRSGKLFAGAVFRFLEETGAAENLFRFAETFPETERRAFLETQSQLWEGLIHVLDLFALLLEDARPDEKRLCELFELALGCVEVATPPRTLDEVAVGTADRMRPEAPRAVFLIGAVEGEFPAVPPKGGLLSDAERKRMAEEGLELIGEDESFLENERMFLYGASSAASERVFVSAPKAEATGEALSPSVLFARAAALSGGGMPQDRFFLARTAAAAAGEFARRFREDTPERAALEEALVRAGRAQTVEQVRRAAERRPHRLEDGAVSQELFGRRMTLSPSKIETYYRCPFSYFAKNGLGLRPLRKAGLSALEEGTLVHEAMERLLQKYGGRGIAGVPEAELFAEAEQFIKEYVRGKVIDPDSLPLRVRHGFERCADAIVRLAKRLGEEFEQSLFEPVAFELPIGGEGEVPPLEVTAPDGTVLRIEGKVDRADVAEIGGKRYLRVIDYKSHGKKFLLSDVFYGLNMQMLIYLFTIWKEGKGALGGLLPAGVLYMPAAPGYLSAGRACGADEMKPLVDKQFRMNGLVLDDPEVLFAMDRSGKGVFIPVTSRGGKDMLASLEELGKTARLVEKRIGEMAQLLHGGGIAAMPAVSDSSPCRFCDYRGVCGFEEGDPERTITLLKREEFLEEEGVHAGAVDSGTESGD